jgi:hypothetical protein
VTTRIVAAVALIGAMIVFGAARADAAPSLTGALTVTAPATFTRGSAVPQVVNIDVPTKEGAVFKLLVAAPFVRGAAATCASSLAGTTCAFNGANGNVTVTTNGGAADEATTVTVGLDVTAALAGDPLNSTEGDSVMDDTKTVKITAVPQGATTTDAGVTPEGTDTAQVVADTTTQSVFEVTSSVTPLTRDRGPGATVTYKGTVSRAGSFNGAAITVTANLLPAAESGTTLGTTNPQTHSFAIGEDSFDFNYTINVPATATLGPSTRHFVITYDPNGTAVAPAVTDTETGADVAFTVTQAAPTVTVELTSTVADNAEVARGSGITYTVTATNTAAAGSQDATNVTVNLPVSTQVTIGATTASNGAAPTVVTGTNPQTVSVNLGTLAPGASATLTVPVTVKATATKTAGANNDITTGPPSGAFQPPAGGTAATVTGTTTFDNEIRPDADVTVDVTGPASVTLDPDDADIDAVYVVSNAGPDPSAGTTLVANPPTSLKPPTSGSVNVTDDGGGTCVVANPSRIVTCTFGTLAAGASTPQVKITWTITGGGGRSLLATASTTTNETPPADANNSDTLPVGVNDPNSNISSTATPNKSTAFVAGGPAPVNDTVQVDYDLFNDGAFNIKATFAVTAPLGTSITALSGPGCPAGPFVGTVTCDVNQINKNSHAHVLVTYTVTAAALPGPVTFSGHLEPKAGSTITFAPQDPSTSVDLALPAVAIRANDPTALEILNIDVGVPQATTVRTFTLISDDPPAGFAVPGPQIKIGLPAGVTTEAAVGCSLDAVVDPIFLGSATSSLTCAVTPDPVPGGGSGTTSPITFKVASSSPDEVSIKYAPSADTTLRRLVPAPAIKEFKLDINFNPVTVADVGPIIPGTGEVTYKVVSTGDTDGGDGDGHGGTPPLAVSGASVSTTTGGTATVAVTVVSGNEVKVDATAVAPTVAADGVDVTVIFSVSDGSGSNLSSLLVNFRDPIAVSANNNFGYARPADATPPKSLGEDVDPALFGERPSIIDPLEGGLDKDAADVLIADYHVTATATPDLLDIGAQNSLVAVGGGDNVVRYVAPKGYTTDRILVGPVADQTQPPDDGFDYTGTAPRFTMKGLVDIKVPNANPIAIDNNEKVLNKTTVQVRPTVNDADGNTICRPQPAGAPAGSPPCQPPDPEVTHAGVTLRFDDENLSADTDSTPLLICAIGTPPAAVGGVIPDPVCPADPTKPPEDPVNKPAFDLGLFGPDHVISSAAGSGFVTAELRSAKHDAADTFDVKDASKVIDLSADAVATGNIALAYVAVDVRGGIDWGQINITIPNTPPAVVGDVQTVFKNTPKIVVDARGVSDANQDNVQIQSVVQPAHGTVTISGDNKTITYSPTKDYLGPDSFSYTVSDGRTDGSADATVQIQVVENPLTTVKGTSGTAAAGAAGTLPATGFDPLGLTVVGGTAILLGAGLAVAAGRRRDARFVPLHARK